MSVFKDMARDAGTHTDAGISLEEAAARHEADYLENRTEEQAETYAEFLQQCEDYGHPMQGNACPCGQRTDWRDL